MTNTRGACEIEPCPNRYGAAALPEWMCPRGGEVGEEEVQVE